MPSSNEEVAMQVLRLPPRHHPKAEISCPPPRAGAAGLRRLKAGALAILTGALLGAAFAYHTPLWRHPAALAGYVLIAGMFAGSLLWLAHVTNVLRRPVVFKVARGELTVTWPHLLSRRTRTVRTSDVTAVEVNESAGPSSEAGRVARLVIRRRHRRPIRVPGDRPVEVLDRVATELRAALHV